MAFDTKQLLKSLKQLEAREKKVLEFLRKFQVAVATLNGSLSDGRRGPRTLSARARRSIASAQKRRWAAFRAKKKAGKKQS